MPAACHTAAISNEDLTHCLPVCQMNAEPGTVKKWKVADISRVVADGVVVEIGRLANEFVRADGEPVQLVLELEDLSARKPNARQNVSMVKVSPWQRPSSAPAPPRGVPGGSGQLVIFR